MVRTENGSYCLRVSDTSLLLGTDPGLTNSKTIAIDPASSHQAANPAAFDAYALLASCAQPFSVSNDVSPATTPLTHTPKRGSFLRSSAQDVVEEMLGAPLNGGPSLRAYLIGR